MSLLAGFAELDITPIVFPARTYWATVDSALDPLYARAAVFRQGPMVVAFLALDVVIIEAPYVAEIRARVSQACGIPPGCLMVSATHNHACPAVIERPWSAKDHAYLALLVERSAAAVVMACQRLAPAEIGTGSQYEGRVSFNRRFILKNGTVISQPSAAVVAREVRSAEAIIDPELGVLCVRDGQRRVIGLLVSFACHAVHHMGSLSAGFPGVLSTRLKAAYGGGVVTLFLNGACGNVIHRNFADPAQVDTMDKIGGILADDVQHLVAGLSYATAGKLAAASTQVALPYREIAGLARNMHRLAEYNVFPGLIQRGWYEWSLARLRELHAQSDHEAAEVQVLRVGDTVFGAIPAEYFAQFALRIKEQSPVAHTFVVTLANGWLGYIPHREAFERQGGHESTWCYSSKMAPDAGDTLADTLLAVIRQLPPAPPA